MTDSGWLSVKQVAEYAGVEQQTVRGWCYRHWVHRRLAVKAPSEGPTGGEAWRIHPSALESIDPSGGVAFVEAEPAPEPRPAVAPGARPAWRMTITGARGEVTFNTPHGMLRFTADGPVVTIEGS
jgi:hypothetical protein